MARRIEPTVFLATISPITVGLVVGAGAVTRVLGGSWAAAVAAGLVVWGARVGVSVFVARRVRRLEPRIDPFALREPWRFFVSDALRARAHFREATEPVPPGALRDRLADMGAELDRGVAAVWEIAQRGQTLTDTRRSIDVGELDRILSTADPDDPRHRSAQAQRDSHDRLAASEDDTRSRLEVLDTQLDEAVVRVAELAARADGAALDDAASRISDVVTGLDAVRLALDELGPSP